jgi:hypothetical protein
LDWIGDILFYKTSVLNTCAQHGVHADGWIHTAKMAFFVALGFVRFVGESTSLQPPVTRAVGRLVFRMFFVLALTKEI